MMATFSIIAGYGSSAFAIASSPKDERQIQSWSHWWMNEIERQIHPVSQLLFVFPLHRPSDPEHKIGDISAPEEFNIFCPSHFPNHRRWHQSNAGWLNTEGFIMPSKLEDIEYDDIRSYARLILLPNEWLLPATGLKPPNEKDDPFYWSKSIPAPATLRSTAFSGAQFEEANPFKLNIPKRLSEYGNDLRLFEYSLRLNTDNPFDSHLEFVGNKWHLLFFRWSPPDLDEMFSTLLPPSQ